MKKFAAIAIMGLCITSAASAATFKGFVQDASCAGKPSMKDDAECAKKCIKGGAAAVLVSEDGTIYKIANQSSILPHAGHNVTIDGTLKGDTITIDKVTM